MPDRSTTDRIETPLTREQMVRRLDAILAPGEEEWPWSSLVPAGVAYAGSSDAKGYIIRRAGGRLSGALQWRITIQDTPDGARVTIRNLSGLRSLLVWCIIGLLLPVIVMVVVIGGFKAGMLATLVEMALGFGIAAAVALAVLYAIIGRDENVDRRFFRELLTAPEEDAKEQSGLSDR
jgi:hypothetical protein